MGPFPRALATRLRALLGPALAVTYWWMVQLRLKLTWAGEAKAARSNGDEGQEAAAADEAAGTHLHLIIVHRTRQRMNMPPSVLDGVPPTN